MYFSCGDRELFDHRAINDMLNTRYIHDIKFRKFLKFPKTISFLQLNATTNNLTTNGISEVRNVIIRILIYI